MCGIAGFLSGKNIENAEQILKSMGEEISHRGPDDFGVWCDVEEGIGFSHRRLSILDLSPLGHQPMQSVSARYMMIFNGEIYNHLEIRDNLEKEYGSIEWRGHSDTETILKSIDLKGIKETVISLVGMFAIALWDKENKELTLVRDRMGEKPLYYGWQGETFLFGSELKSFKIHSSFVNEIDKNALSLYFRYNYVPAPYSIYKGINKLIPGSILTISLKSPNEKVEKYWDLHTVVQKEGVNNDDETNSIDKLEKLLKDSIDKQMLSDVPLGAFLSGGIDSSLIVGIMQSISEKPIKTFTIGFNEQKFNEAEFAKKIATYLGTDHTELYINPDDCLNVIPQLPHIYDEPFSDSSQIPTFLVTKLAKEKVTVALSGDAGDELFAGYNRYILANNTWSKLNKMPLFLRSIISSIILAFSADSWNFIYANIRAMIPSKYRMENFGDKIHKSAFVLNSKNLNELYNRLISHWTEEDNLVKGSDILPLLDLNKFNTHSDIESMMALDSLTYLPDDILVKVDRAAMSNSLETRVPFLDHRIVELAWKTNMKYKIKNGQGKWILRQILYKYVPKELIERPKMGFGVPIDSWLRGPLKNWAEDLLDEKQLIEDGILNPEPILKKWKEHLSGKRNWQYHLWDVLMFQAWYRLNFKRNQS